MACRDKYGHLLLFGDLNVFRPRLLQSPFLHLETTKSNGMRRPSWSLAFVVPRLSKSPFHPKISKSDGMQGRWWSSISNRFFFEIYCSSLCHPKTSESDGKRGQTMVFHCSQNYWSFPCYPETIESDGMQRPSQSSVFNRFQGTKALLMHLMSLMLFLLTGFADWASGWLGGEFTRTKLVSYLFFPFISNKR